MVVVIKLGQPGVEEGFTMEEHFNIIEQPSPSSQGDFVSDTVTLPKARVGASTNDQRFLLVFILGTYFGPDLRDDVPRKSALQRAVMGLPPYSADQLGGSVFKLSEIESIYYFALRYPLLEGCQTHQFYDVHKTSDSILCKKIDSWEVSGLSIILFLKLTVLGMGHGVSVEGNMSVFAGC